MPDKPPHPMKNWWAALSPEDRAAFIERRNKAARAGWDKYRAENRQRARSRRPSKP